MSQRPRRLVFGEVAELYDASRPTYPDALIDDLAGWAADGPGSARALEVGAGTGKATRLLAARGVAVLAIEPNPEMAGIARRTSADSGHVEVLESDFEHADLGGRRFPLLFAAQAWHWVDQTAGYRLARAALEPGGRLVAFWSHPAWPDSPLRRALDDVYRTYVTTPSGGPMDPRSRDHTVDETSFWSDAVAATDGLDEPQARVYEWSLSYTADGYADLLATMSEVRLLDPVTRGRLLDGCRETIAEHGGTLPMPMVTRAAIARAV